MTRQDRDLLARYRATTTGPRTGNWQDWNVDRLEDGGQAHVTVHAMCGAAAAIRRAITDSNWRVPGRE